MTEQLVEAQSVFGLFDNEFIDKVKYIVKSIDIDKITQMIKAIEVKDGKILVDIQLSISAGKENATV